MALRTLPSIRRLLVGFALVIAACGGPMSDVDSTSSASTLANSDPPAAVGVAAPDFSLELGDGGTFELSAATLPTYLVFWAEW